MKTTFGSKIAVGAFVLGLAVLIGCGGGGGGGSSSTSTTTTPTTSTTVGTTGTIYDANQIVYGLGNSDQTTFNVNELSTSGTVKKLFSNISNNIFFFAQVPGSTNKFVVAALDPNSSTGATGIYLTTGLNLTNATTLVSSTYQFVSSLSVTADGKNVVYSASSSSDATGTIHLFVEKVSGGTPVQYGQSDSSTVSPADSDTILFTASTDSSGNDQLFTRSLKAGTGGTPTQITTNAALHLLPAFSADGKKIAYWEQTPLVNSFFVETLASKAVASLSNPNLVTPLATSFNGDGTQIAVAADLNGVGEIYTQLTDGTAVPNAPLLSNSTSELGQYGVYWTDSNGRSISGRMMPNATAARKKAFLAAKAPKH